MGLFPPGRDSWAAARLGSHVDGRRCSAAHLTQIRAEGYRAAHRIECRVADDEVVVGAVRAERIVAGRADLRALLPPAVLAADHLGIEVLVEPRARPNAPLRCLEDHPVSRADSTRGGGARVQLKL